MRCRGQSPRHEVHGYGWIDSQRLLTGAGPIPCKAPNGGGYTLESMLGIYPNGIAEPDYLGWEVKQFGVTDFPAKGAKPSTLMTPEPDGGFYKSQGAIDFVREFGYADKAGRNDRINFGGKHVTGKAQALTGLEMVLTGFDPTHDQITDADGAVCLLDRKQRIAASWSFAKLMEHWQRKHAQAVYVPCLRRTVGEMHQYHFGKDVELGTGTTFEILLSALHKGTVYYDPGIKLEDASGQTPRIKRRSQFRISHGHLATLYRQMEAIDLKHQA